MIQVRLDDVLNDREQSLYWLQQQTGIAYTTLWRLKIGRANSISFPILDAICDALECQPSDLLIKVEEGASKKGGLKGSRPGRMIKKGK